MAIVGYRLILADLRLLPTAPTVTLYGPYYYAQRWLRSQPTRGSRFLYGCCVVIPRLYGYVTDLPTLRLFPGYVPAIYLPTLR